MSITSRFNSGSRIAACAFTVAALTTLAAASPAQASGTQAEEVNRKVVHYMKLSSCAGTSNLCNISITNSPGQKRKFLEIHNLSCRVILDDGIVYSATVQGGTSSHIYEFLALQDLGAYSSDKVILARNANETVARRNDDIRVHINATGDIKSLVCTLNGEVVTYQ